MNSRHEPSTNNSSCLSLGKIEDRIGNFLNKCPHCGHKQYSYTRECEECRFSWLRYYNQLKGNPLDTPYNKQLGDIEK